MSTAARQRRMFTTLPADGWNQRREFWTQRKKAATSLLSVMALVAGIAVAFKLFDQTVPNNVVRDASTFAFELLKMEEAVGDTDFVPAEPGSPIFVDAGPDGDQFPGDTRTVDVRIRNTNLPARNASFQMHIPPSDIEVWGCRTGSTPLPVNPDGTCPAGATEASATAIDPLGPAATARSRFLAFWTLEVEVEQVLVVNGQDVHHTTYTTTCEGAVRLFPANAPCELRSVKAAGSETLTTQPTDERNYRFHLEEIDDGTDQSAFKGWFLNFPMIFSARVPALPDSVNILGER